jgi:hypothetical protein
MKTAFTVFLLLAGLTAPAWARLGEGADQIANRYGIPLTKEVEKPAPGRIAALVETFQKNGFSITVTLVNGASAAESFKKLNGSSFNSEEQQTLLAANAGDGSWQAPQNVSGRKQWTRDDGSVATLSGGTVLTIISADMLAAVNQAKQLEAAPSLQGF